MDRQHISEHNFLYIAVNYPYMVAHAYTFDNKGGHEINLDAPKVCKSNMWASRMHEGSNQCWRSLTITSDRQLRSKTGEINKLLTHAFTIDIVPLVLEDTCFAGHTFEYKWKTRQKEQFKKCNADPISTKRKRAHPTYKFGPSTDMGMI